jgi:ribonuclease VapC
VLDASALLTLLFREAGAAAVAHVIAQGAAVSVNLSEVAAVLVRHERETDRMLRAVAAQVTVEPFITADALAAAALRAPTRVTGLSLGDRACLALAQRLELPAVTVDCEWVTVNVGIAIHLVRPARG